MVDKYYSIKSSTPVSSGICTITVNDNVPYPDTVGGNTVNTCLELGSPSGTDTASVIKFNGRDGSGNLNKCQMQWCGANNRFDITVNGNQA